jgi:hypothetical protein
MPSDFVFLGRLAIALAIIFFFDSAAMAVVWLWLSPR